MKCENCEHHTFTVSDNPYCEQKKKSHQCRYPVKDIDGAILVLQSKKYLSYKDYKSCPKWCPLKR